MSSNSNSEPKPAATVLMVRETNSGPEVFMVTRHHQIDFAAGALVFPGGKLDKEDTNPELLEYAGGEFSAEELAVRICGIRETFEEAGVLLARDNQTGKIIDGTRCMELAGVYREQLHSGGITLLDIVREEELSLAYDQLLLFARWITPSFFIRRFDACFFLVKAPKDYVATHDDVESIDSIWVRPKVALADADAGLKTIVFATRMNLQKLARYQSTKEMFEATEANEVVIVEPGYEETNGNITFTIPIEAGYGITEYTEYGGPSLKIKGKSNQT